MVGAGGWRKAATVAAFERDVQRAIRLLGAPGPATDAS